MSHKKETIRFLKNDYCFSGCEALITKNRHDDFASFKIIIKGNVLFQHKKIA
jgi:hypothetical protein